VKEIRVDTNEKKSHIHGLKGLISLKYPHYRLNIISNKPKLNFLIKVEKKVLKFIENNKDPKVDKAISVRQTKLEKSHFLISKYIAELQ
jgi:hypothetical protein